MDQNFKDLAKKVARKQAPENFTVENANEAFRKELASYCASLPMFLKNRYDLYQIVIENADEVVPNKLIDALGIFAEVKTVPQNQKAIFKTSNVNSKLRAKKFLTRAALAGVYETFRLDSTTFEVPCHAVGSAVTVDFERLLDGAETLADVMDVITDGLADNIYLEVQNALRNAVKNNLSDVNRVIASGFEAEKMFKLCTVAKAYGTNAVIFATPEFIGAMGPDAIVPVTAAGAQGIYHPQDIDRIHNQGYINIFRGCPVVTMPQSFVDTTNTKTWLDPQIAYVLPAGKEKIVKVALEGGTQMYDWQNKDNSMEMQVYRKIGVAISTYYNFCAYQNTAIPQTLYNPYVNL